jgi:DNA-binding FadR family transcriptional regulator
MNESGHLQALRLNRERLHGQIADSIQNMVGVGHLGLGDRLPSERDLAGLFGVNRSTVREAIRLLQQRGLVQMKSGSGTFVTDIPQSVIAESIERYCVLGSCSHNDLVSLRGVLEPEMAALAAERVTPQDLARLQDQTLLIEKALADQDQKQYEIADLGFHLALANATHNELIGAIFDGLQRTLRAWLEERSHTFHMGRGARSHRAVFDAVEAGDPEGARQAMKAHMIYTRASLPDPELAPVTTASETQRTKE